ncbi:MAG: recombinase family protein [Clostridia bacterium]|nr:recombinase family protein [Clostridia bacterium]
MNGVIYARYSSDNQREESIEGQLRECNIYAEKNGINIIENYIDRAHTATNDNRPDFQRMIKDSAKGKFDIILVWKLDRFARNRYDSARYKHQLKKNGVKVVSATESIADGPDGILMESILEGYAEFYSAELSEKVIRGMTENALKCKCNGGKLTFGYMNVNHYYQIDSARAPIVLKIFEMYDSGMTIKEITNYLVSAGIKTGTGSTPNQNFVNRILLNRRYIGEYRYRDIIKPHGIPAIVPEELFNRVQDKMKMNKKAPARHKATDDYILTTKLFCGCCKCFMVGECGTSGSGEVYRYYRCVNSKRGKTCKANHKSIRKIPLENAVIKHVKSMLMDDEFVDSFAAKAYNSQEKESAELTALKSELSNVEKSIKNLISALEQGIITDTTKERLNELEKAKSELKSSIAGYEIKSPVFSYNEIKYYILSFRSIDFDSLKGRESLINHFVKSVIVNDDKIIVTLNYNNKEGIFSFDEIEGTESSSDITLMTQPKKEVEALASASFFVCIDSVLSRSD